MIYYCCFHVDFERILHAALSADNTRFYSDPPPRSDYRRWPIIRLKSILSNAGAYCYYYNNIKIHIFYILLLLSYRFADIGIVPIMILFYWNDDAVPPPSTSKDLTVSPLARCYSIRNRISLRVGTIILENVVGQIIIQVTRSTVFPPARIAYRHPVRLLCQTRRYIIPIFMNRINGNSGYRSPTKLGSGPIYFGICITYCVIRVQKLQCLQWCIVPEL